MSRPAYISFFNFNVSCAHPSLGAARRHPGQPDGGAAAAQRNPQETERVHAEGEGRLPQTVDTVRRNTYSLFKHTTMPT